MTCNHAEMTTPFCPECGHKAEETPIQALRRHVLGLTNRHDRALKAKPCVEAQVRYDRWSARLAALDDLIAAKAAKMERIEEIIPLTPDP